MYVYVQVKLRTVLFVIVEHQKVREDVLGMMMLARDTLTGQGLTDTELYDQVITLMLAGHEVSRSIWSIHTMRRLIVLPSTSSFTEAVKLKKKSNK